MPESACRGSRGQIEIVEPLGVGAENLGALIGSELLQAIEMIAKRIGIEAGGMRIVRLEHDRVRSKVPHRVQKTLSFGPETDRKVLPEDFGYGSWPLGQVLRDLILQRLQHERHPADIALHRREPKPGMAVENAGHQ